MLRVKGDKRRKKTTKGDKGQQKPKKGNERSKPLYLLWYIVRPETVLVSGREKL